MICLVFSGRPPTLTGPLFTFDVPKSDGYSSMKRARQGLRPTRKSSSSVNDSKRGGKLGHKNLNEN